jgi:Rha family phage regulatory protein
MNDLIQTIDGQPWTTSNLVAEKFGKLHKDVLKAIRNLQSSEEFNRRNFAPIEYRDGRGRMMPAFLIRRDGFSMLAMGFTGREAAQWREKFIAAFNKMEAALRPRRPKSVSTVRDRRALYHAAVDLMADRGLSLPAAYQLFDAYAGVPHMDLMTPERIGEVVEFAERARTRQTTSEDWMRVEAGRQKLLTSPNQLDLIENIEPQLK